MHSADCENDAMPSPVAPEAPLVLVVDDEPSIVELLSAGLQFSGFEVVTAAGGAEALTLVHDRRPDLIVLDVMMPELDGFGVMARLREQGIATPVIFLTARDETTDRITGLRHGADDYVTKPFSLEELVLRIRAVLRRGGMEESGETLAFADLEMDDVQHRVTKAGAPVDLSPTEYNLLRYFLLNPNRVLAKAQILDHVWEYDFAGDGNVVETYVSYLRRKLDTSDPRLLHTVRGVGYVLRRPR